jgi:hypothetical protein
MRPRRKNKSEVRLRTRKIIDRLTYSPETHKQKFAKSLRRTLALRPSEKPSPIPPPNSHLKFGSININGLDLEAHWAVTQLLDDHNFDVSNNSENKITIIYMHHYRKSSTGPRTQRDVWSFRPILDLARCARVFLLEDRERWW